MPESNGEPECHLHHRQDNIESANGSHSLEQRGPVSRTPNRHRVLNGVALCFLIGSWITSLLFWSDRSEELQWRGPITVVVLLIAGVFVKFAASDERASNESASQPTCGQCGISLRPNKSRCHFCGWSGPPTNESNASTKAAEPCAATPLTGPCVTTAASDVPPAASGVVGNAVDDATG